MQAKLRSEFGFWDKKALARQGKPSQPGEFENIPFDNGAYGEIRHVRWHSLEGSLFAVTRIGIQRFEPRFAKNGKGKTNSNKKAGEALVEELKRHLPESAAYGFKDRFCRELEIRVPLDPQSHPDLLALFTTAKKHEETVRKLEELAMEKRILRRALRTQGSRLLRTQ